MTAQQLPKTKCCAECKDTVSQVYFNLSQATDDGLKPVCIDCEEKLKKEKRPRSEDPRFMYSQNGKRGGESTKAKLGTRHFSDMGKRGGNVVKEKYGSDYFSRIARGGTATEEPAPKAEAEPGKRQRKPKVEPEPTEGSKVCRDCKRDRNLVHFAKTRYGGYWKVCRDCHGEAIKRGIQATERQRETIRMRPMPINEPEPVTPRSLVTANEVRVVELKAQLNQALRKAEEERANADYYQGQLREALEENARLQRELRDARRPVEAPSTAVEAPSTTVEAPSTAVDGEEEQ